MKKILPLFLALFQYAAAQTITQAANEPVSGDLRPVYELDTSAYTSALPIHQTGSSAVWNVQNLVPIPGSYSITYISPGAIPEGSLFPTASVVQDSQDGSYFFIKSTTTPTTQMEIVGLTFPGLTLTFTNSAIAIKYPAALGFTHSDNAAGTVTFATINGTFNGNISTSVDGLGTLQLAGGVTYSNVLRVKSVQTVTATSGFFPLGTLSQTTFQFYHSSEKFPILSVNYMRLAPTASTPTTVVSVQGNVAAFSTGTPEHSRWALNIVPNPVSDLLFVDHAPESAFRSMRIIDVNGKVVKQQDFSREINVSELQPGIYLLEVLSDRGTHLRKFIKNH